MRLSMTVLHIEFTSSARALHVVPGECRGMKRIAVLCLAAAFFACGPKEQTSSSSALTINGAGATFPNPIYSKWFDDYRKAHPDVQVNYQSTGSGGGIKQLTGRKGLFRARDMAPS